MIYFYQPIIRGTIFAKKRNGDESTSVIATCEHTNDRIPSLHTGWEVLDKTNMNGVSQVAFCMALATAWSANQHAAFLLDLLTNHAAVLSMKD